MITWYFNKGNENKKAVFSKLNGSEPIFNKNKCNNNLKIKKTHNCYAYVLDIIDKNLKKKPQPGYSNGYSYIEDNDIRKCDKMFSRIKADNPTTIKSSYSKECPAGYRKGYLAVDDGSITSNTDYHFYRLDSSGLWSHKPGSTNAKMENTNGELIIAPHLAKRDSNSHKYDKSCGYFCFDHSKSHISNKPLKNKLRNKSKNM